MSGTYEAGNMLIAKIFGVTSTAGLTLALCRRARTVFWAGIGAMCMIVMKKAEAPRTLAAEARSGGRAVPRRIGLRRYSYEPEQTIFEWTQA